MCRVSSSAADWSLLLEFSIPLKEARIDVVLLVRNRIFLLEAKSGTIDSSARKQAEQYGLLLHYFHKASDQRYILPVAVSTAAIEESLTDWRQQGMFPQLASYWVKPVLACRWSALAQLLLSCEDASEPQLSYMEWNNSPYFPVPSIIEAALELRSGLSIAEIAHSEAAEHEIQHVRDTIQNCLCAARDKSQHAICFLTGVPGSGKTLVGLSLAHLSENRTDAVHFMSGNGPLVKVMQHLLTREGMRKGARKEDAEREARTLLGNIHVFARYHEEDNSESHPRTMLSFLTKRSVRGIVHKITRNLNVTILNRPCCSASVGAPFGLGLYRRASRRWPGDQRRRGGPGGVGSRPD